MKKDGNISNRLDEIAHSIEKLTERINSIDKNTKQPEKTNRNEQNTSILLVQAIEEYYQSLVNYNVRSYEERQLSNRYIHRIFQVFKLLKEEILNHGKNYAAFKV